MEPLQYILYVMYDMRTHLCDYMFGSINIRMRRTDARLCQTDAHNIKLYIYIYMMMMGMDGLDGYWMENMCVLMVFWMGLGGLGCFLDHPGLI